MTIKSFFLPFFYNSNNISVKTDKIVWTKYIRSFLGLTQKRLGKILNIRANSYCEYELSEENQTIKLCTLKNYAEALDLELVYFFRPKNGLTFEEYFLNLTKQHSKNNVDSYSLNKGIIINNDDEKLALISELQQFYLDNPKKMWE